LTGHLFPSTVGSLDINFDEGREAQLEKLAASSTPQLTDIQTNNLIQVREAKLEK